MSSQQARLRELRAGHKDCRVAPLHIGVRQQKQFPVDAGSDTESEAAHHLDDVLGE